MNEMCTGIDIDFQANNFNVNEKRKIDSKLSFLMAPMQL